MLNEARRAAFKAGQLPEGCPTPADARASIAGEESALRRRWADLIRRKRSGELTDETRIRAVERAVATLGKLHEIPLRFEQREGKREDGSAASTWMLEASFAGDTATFDFPRWLKFFDKVDDELRRTFPFIEWASCEHGTFVDEQEVPPGYWDARDAEMSEQLAAFEEEGENDTDVDVAEDDGDGEGEPVAGEPVWGIDDPYTRASRSYAVDCWVWEGPE